MEPIEIYDRGRGPELKRIRITVHDIAPYWMENWPPEKIAPLMTLTVDEVKALIKCIEENKEEVVAHYHKIEERNARGNPPEIEERLKGSHERLLAYREALRRNQEEAKNGAGFVDRH